MESFVLNDQPVVKPARILPRPEQFPGRTGDIIRFGDLDPQGHVNNTVFATYFETGRVMLLREPGNELGAPGVTTVLARLDISFLREMHWPGTVEIGTGTTQIGRSSYSISAGDLPRGRMRSNRERHNGDDRSRDPQGAPAAG